MAIIVVDSINFSLRNSCYNRKIRDGKTIRAVSGWAAAPEPETRSAVHDLLYSELLTDQARAFITAYDLYYITSVHSDSPCK